MAKRYGHEDKCGGEYQRGWHECNDDDCVAYIDDYERLQAENEEQTDFLALAKEEMDELQAENKQLRAELKNLRGIMKSINQRAMNAAPIHDIVVLSEQALEGE